MACRDPGGAKCTGTQTAYATGVMALSESFFKLLVVGNQKASLASLSPNPTFFLKKNFNWGIIAFQFYIDFYHACMHPKSLQSCLTLCDPMNCKAPGQEKSHVRNWRSKGHLAPLMRPTKFPEIPVSLERNTEVFRHPLL